MCAPEMALNMLYEKGKSMHTVFVCDVMNGAQQWMAHLGLKPVLTDMNGRLWNKDAGVMISKPIDGELVRLTAESADVDLYV